MFSCSTLDYAVAKLSWFQAVVYITLHYMYITFFNVA